MCLEVLSNIMPDAPDEVDQNGACKIGCSFTFNTSDLASIGIELGIHEAENTRTGKQGEVLLESKTVDGMVGDGAGSWYHPPKEHPQESFMPGDQICFSSSLTPSPTTTAEPTQTGSTTKPTGSCTPKTQEPARDFRYIKVVGVYDPEMKGDCQEGCSMNYNYQDMKDLCLEVKEPHTEYFVKNSRTHIAGKLLMYPDLPQGWEPHHKSAGGDAFAKWEYEKAWPSNSTHPSFMIGDEILFLQYKVSSALLEEVGAATLG